MRSSIREQRLTDGPSVDLHGGVEISQEAGYVCLRITLLDHGARKRKAAQGEDGEVREAHDED